MNNIISKYFKNNSILWISFFIIWTIGLVYSFTGNQIETHVELNSFHTPWADTFFKYITLLGEDLPFYIIGIIILLNFREGFFLLLAQGICSLITQIFKYGLAHPRPYTLFKQLGIDLPSTVEGVELWNAFNSFPSGHTSCIFAFIAGIAAILPYRYRYLQIFWIIIAFLTGFSRIYLSQHFLADVLAGSLVGMVSVALTYVLVYYKPRKNINLINAGIKKLGQLLTPNSQLQ